ncbi:hypothetical protein G3545_18975 [Starkeya sp. ORNL1]|uniref:type III secretion apparatus assembly protein SctX n=1 Tax=Starkeya sp. ORNL1 TaxID=2709380 RepID=UPI001463B406|nr:hypothetical protein [Starkeya sp. ORNL1]QJP15555.1 hypothetical protein G3545_18975 [Starkeya sp. ORNL1]
MRIRNLDIGLESITRWDVADEVHLPRDGTSAPAFMPQYRPLEEILQRPSLDERLPEFLRPATVDPDLLDPTALADARVGARSAFVERSLSASGRSRDILEQAATLLGADIGLDDEIRSALAALLRA